MTRGMLPRKAPKIPSAATAAPAEGRDDISNLPDGVLQHILSFLPAQDVVRTCVLAKRWRHLWKSISGLRFVCGGLKEPESAKQVEFVDQLLRLRIREDTPLDMCEFCVEVEKFDMSHIVHWIRIALQCKVLQLICVSWTWGNIPYLDSHPLFISQYLKKRMEDLSRGPTDFLTSHATPIWKTLRLTTAPS